MCLITLQAHLHMRQPVFRIFRADCFEADVAVKVLQVGLGADAVALTGPERIGFCQRFTQQRGAGAATAGMRVNDNAAQRGVGEFQPRRQ